MSADEWLKIRNLDTDLRIRAILPAEEVLGMVCRYIEGRMEFPFEMDMSYSGRSVRIFITEEEFDEKIYGHVLMEQTDLLSKIKQIAAKNERWNANISEGKKKKYMGCPFPYKCDRFPCDTMYCEGDCCDNGYVRRSY